MTRKRKPGRCRRAVTRARDWRPAFLASLASTGNITVSAREIGVGRSTVHEYRDTDAAFDRQCRDALLEAGDLLEAEARRRAYDGVDEPVIHQGEMSGVWIDDRGKQVTHTTPGARFVGLTVKRYSDSLLMFLLKACKPRRFREHHKVDVGGRVKVRHEIDLTKLSDDQLEALEDIAETVAATAGRAGDPGGAGTPQPA